MTEISLNQADADALLEMEKHRLDDTPWDYPGAGESIRIPLQSGDQRERFSLDLSRGRIALMRGKYQNRARQVFVLARLDFGGPPHRNPDDIDVPSPHIHLYREGFGDKWAYPVPQEHFGDLADPWATLQDFMRYCRILTPPNIRRGLFT